MRSLVAMLRYEALLQWRTGRFRLAVVLYVVLCAVPPLLVAFLLRHQSVETLGAASYLAQTLAVQPFLTTMFVALVAGNRSSLQAMSEAWPVLSGASMSSTGFVARRWLALLTLILPITLIPLLVTFAAAMAGGVAVFEARFWVTFWMVLVLPLAILISAYWLGAVMVFGGELGALLFSLLALPLSRELINQLLIRFRLTLEPLSDWTGYQSFARWVYLTSASLKNRAGDRQDFSLVATEAPIDTAYLTGWLLPRAILFSGISLCVLGFAVAFLRRTRRDLPPRVVSPQHQLRTLLEMLNRQRERYAPDGGLGRRERLAVLLGVLALGTGLTAALGLQRHYQGLAGERYKAEMEADYEPLPLHVETLAWKVSGRFSSDGRAALQALGRLVNRGDEPQSSLVFSLNPSLAVETVTADSRSISQERSWDRIRLTLEPPLAAGEAMDLHFQLAGVPRDIRFFPRRSDYPYVMLYENVQRTPFPADMWDLARSPRRRAATQRRVSLAAVDLAPSPRYTPWTLTRPEDEGNWDSGAGLFGRRVPPEIQRQPVDIEIDLKVPPRWFLADTCGNVSRTEGGLGHLSGSCRSSLLEYRVLGGPLVAFGSGRDSSGPAVAPSAEGEVVFAALPAHRQQAEAYRESLALVAALSDRAWPGMQGLDGLVALEWPPPASLNLKRGMRRWSSSEPELVGRLLKIPEHLLVSREAPPPERLVAMLLSRDLRARRQVVEGQEPLFSSLYSSLMLRRMGLAKKGATVSGPGWMRPGLRVAILEAEPNYGYTWNHRLPAVLVEVESRVGRDPLYAGVESFLSVESGEPGSIEELFAELEMRTGVSLARMYKDHFVGRALPMLRLVDISSVRENGVWRVAGALRNTGTGQSVCPIVVKTEVAERVIRVTVDSEAESPFSLFVSSRPHTILLDPDRTCYRWQTKTSAALERISLSS